MKGKPRWRYTVGFKSQAIELLEPGRPVPELVEELEVSLESLEFVGGWLASCAVSSVRNTVHGGVPEGHPPATAPRLSSRPHGTRWTSQKFADKSIAFIASHPTGIVEKAVSIRLARNQKLDFISHEVRNYFPGFSCPLSQLMIRFSCQAGRFPEFSYGLGLRKKPSKERVRV